MRSTSFPPVSLALFLLLLSPAARPQDMAEVTIQTVPVAPGLHMLVGRGGNIAVLHGADGVLLVDDQYAPLTEKIRAAVAALDAGPIRFVINTHWHGDHTGGNENLGESGTVIVAHENVRRRMSVEQVMQIRDRTVPASPPAALPVITFPEEVGFHMNGVHVQARHAPAAHTDGDTILWFDGRDAVHMGDTYFNGMYPFIDVDSGGGVDGIIAAASGVLDRAGPATKIIPGHGPLSGHAELERYRDMLVTVRDRVKLALTEGRSVDELVAEKPTADLDALWGGGFMKPDDFVRLVAAGLR